MTIYKPFGLTGCVAAVLVATTAMPVMARPTELTFAHIFQPGHSAFVGAEAFATRVADETDGRVIINVVPAGALGGMDSNLEGLSLGSVDIAFAGASYTSQYYKPMSLTAAPYAFQSEAHFDKFIGSDLYNEMNEGFDEATGNHIVGAFTTGFRNVTSNTPVREPADMKGMKIRVPDAEMFTAMPLAVGANPTPVAFAEVYLALQQGVVDAEENPIDTIYSMKFYEVQKYVNLTHHMMEPAYLILSGAAWDRLSDADRATIAGIGDEVSKSITADARERTADLLKTLQEHGTEVVRDVDIPAFAATVHDFNTSDARGWSKAQFDALESLNQ
ncbi:DctP family TRAP transporter solute-binding subunit [Martelella soudanensis]|uniref:DctP family TRAP transporter solute-binding subunit n=1 Tax=unclassified Martelella TaxID=2629616 RepID=UPI0015DF9CB1|nr:MULTISPECIES: DctP family TRAP transporter solute-binding subunit [unclassified Martelella]